MTSYSEPKVIFVVVIIVLVILIGFLSFCLAVRKAIEGLKEDSLEKEGEVVAPWPIFGENLTFLCQNYRIQELQIAKRVSAAR